MNEVKFNSKVCTTYVEEQHDFETEECEMYKPIE